MATDHFLTQEGARAALLSFNRSVAASITTLHQDPELSAALGAWISVLHAVSRREAGADLDTIAALLDEYEPPVYLAASSSKYSFRADIFLDRFGSLSIDVGDIPDVLTLALNKASGSPVFKTEIFLASLFARAQREQPRPINLHLCHAEADQSFADELYLNLKVAENRRRIRLTGRDRVPLGSKVDSTMHNYLDEADIIIWFVSPAFAPSCEWAIDRTIKLRQCRHVAVVPILIRPTFDWKSLCEDIQPLPRDGRAIAELPRDAAWVAVLDELNRLLESLEGLRGTQRT